MTFEEVNPADLPADLPPIDPEACPGAAAAQAGGAPGPGRAAAREAARAGAGARAAAPRRQPKPEQKANEKSVDFEIDKEEEPSPEAKFLAEKNNRVEQETRAERTNLEKEQRGEAPSQSPSDRQDPEEGDPEDKIAQLEDRKSKLGRQAPEGHPAPEAEPGPARTRTSASRCCRMRETPQRQHEISPETVDTALPRDPEGVRAMPDERPAGMKDMPGRSGQSSRTSLRLSSKQYEYLFGDDAEAAERFAQTEKSKQAGAVQQAHGPGAWRRWRTSSPRCGPATRPS